MTRPHRRRATRVLAASAVVILATTAATATGAQAQEEEQPPAPQLITNGSFDDGHEPWWGTENVTLDSTTGQLCADIPGETTNPWDVIIGYDNLALTAGESYELKLFATGTPASTGRIVVQEPVDPYTAYFSVSPEFSASGNEYTWTFTATADQPEGQLVFQLGGETEPWTFCMDNVSLTGGAEPPTYNPDTGPRIRVNQVGYLPNGPKNATVVTEETEPLLFKVRNADGSVVTRGRTVPRGVDPSSGQNVHSLRFTWEKVPATGLVIEVDGETSHPFDISETVYDEMRLDALKFYYTQRSGIEILDELRPGYARPAGHVGVAPNQGDTEVPCMPETCDYTLNVAGGWYDAGDHGKYVVNGGISAWQLMNIYERSLNAGTGQPETLGDGSLDIPESANNVPDILDEARWEQEFLLSMQVPDGQDLAGMVHHKIHDAEWTGLPLMPHADEQPRYLHPPTTAATLNLAATAAQSARIFRDIDPAFADRNLAAARKAWDAAMANPEILADPADGIGGGAYNDDVVADEFYWAAAELYITTGERVFKDYLLAHELHTADIWRDRGFDWGNVAQLGRLDLALLPNGMPDRHQIRASVSAGATRYMETVDNHAYGIPYAPEGNTYDWGSNNLVINNMIVMAVAYDINGNKKFRDAAIQGMDYILGRNALNRSYVTGYGEYHSKNQHSRWYANQLDPDLPNPPKGTLSGGPNSSIQDPVAQQLLQGCAPQFCYLDDIESWSTNELTINWNAPLAWMASFIADQDAG